MPGLDAGLLRYKITIRRYTTTELPSGEEVKDWADFATVHADVVFGTGQERRQAAQETSSVTATFHVRRNAKTRTVTPADQVRFDGGDWNIISAVPSREWNDGVDITAKRRTA